MITTELQRLVFPAKDCDGSSDSYIRKAGGHYCKEKRCFLFNRNLEFNTLTFYNAFSVAKWQKNTSVDSLFLRLRGSGEVILQLMLAKLDNVRNENEHLLSNLAGQETVKTVLREERVELDSKHFFDMDLTGYNKIRTGLIYFNIIPIEDGSLFYAGYLTRSPASQAVKLGLIITHFNRQKQLERAVNRIRNDFLYDDEFKNCADLIIVDNSRNSGVEEDENLRIIDSDNLGGSGGFSRGLLELARAGHYTHCVFMDDDASCEIEALRRTFRLMMFSTTPRMAVAGALLYEGAASRIYEKGAIFDGLCRRIHPNLNVSSERELIYAEEEDIKPNYGGWWFFGFKLTDVQFYPFPFFVRGDDISFSLMNRFNIVTINGIAAYGDTFESKNGAMTTYLDVRSHLVQQIAILKHSRLKVLESLCRFFLKSLLSFEYGNARAVTLATADLAIGTDFFLENIDMSSRIPVLRSLSSPQVATDFDSVASELDFIKPRREPVLRKLARALTINGVLLPNRALKDRCVFQNQGFRARFSETYLYRRIYYASDRYSNGYIIEMDRWEMVACSWDFLKKLVYLARHYRAVHRDYSRNVPEIMSKDFWAKRFPE